MTSKPSRQRDDGLPDASEVRRIDEANMTSALAEARRALRAGEVPVGVIIVSPIDNKILASGFNETNATRDPTRHAEVVAIRRLFASNPTATGCTLYSTCEPCIMCEDVVQRCGFVQRVVYGCANPRFGGHESLRASSSTLAYDTGVLKLEAVQLLREFYAR